jgi:hypothetical protein
MFCNKCGLQQQPGSNFCSRCGNRIAAPNGNAQQNGHSQLLVARKSSMAGTWSKIRVFLDGVFLRELANGEFAYFKISNGKHYIYFEATGHERTESFEFIGNQNEIGYEVSFNSLAQFIFNPLPRQTLLVNKIRETQPGTLKG